MENASHGHGHGASTLVDEPFNNTGVGISDEQTPLGRIGTTRIMNVSGLQFTLGRLISDDVA